MIRCNLRLFVFLVGLASARGTVAQTPRTITIDPAGESARVFLSYMDAGSQGNFAKMFEIPMYQDYRPLALLLTNASGQAIVALTIRWTGTWEGKSGIYDSSSDSLRLGGPAFGSSSMMRMMGPGQARQLQGPMQLGQSHSSGDGPLVAANGERMLVAPGLFARESTGSAGGSSNIPQALLAAELISATLDTVVLEDGTVLGPDGSHTVDGLRAQWAVIRDLVNAVRAAEQNGQDGVDALRQLANARPAPGDGPEKMQQGRIARMLMSSRQWKEQLAKMAEIQLPNFHR